MNFFNKRKEYTGEIPPKFENNGFYYLIENGNVIWEDAMKDAGDTILTNIFNLDNEELRGKLEKALSTVKESKRIEFIDKCVIYKNYQNGLKNSSSSNKESSEEIDINKLTEDQIEIVLKKMGLDDDEALIYCIMYLNKTTPRHLIDEQLGETTVEKILHLVKRYK